MGGDGLLVVGQLSLDDLRSEYGEVRGQPGGAALYVAIAAAQQGCEVMLAAGVGRDYPDLTKLRLPSLLRLDGVRVKTDRSTRVRLARDRGRMIEWSVEYEPGYVWPDEVDCEWKPRLIHLCAMPSALTDAWKAQAADWAVRFTLGLASGLGHREHLDELSHAQARHLVNGTDLLFANAREAMTLTMTSDVPRLAERITGMGVNHAIVTNGAFACFYASSMEPGFECPVVPVARVVDTTGAGDSLAGSVLGARLRGLGYHAALRLGIACAGRVIADFGPKSLFAVAAAEASS